jgi:ATP synthase F0 subunit b
MEGLFKLFENNLINWLLLVGFLIYLWLKVTPAMFAGRKEQIENALKEAEQAHKEGQEFFNQQKARIENAEHESEKILAEARKVAEEMKAEISAQTKTEIESLSHRIDQQIKAETNQAKTEMRRRAATVAVRLAEASLPGAITSSAKSKLHSQFIGQLESGKITGNGNGSGGGDK